MAVSREDAERAARAALKLVDTPDRTTEAYEFTLLRDLKPKLDRREMIRGCIPAGGFGCAYAGAGAGKTAIITDMLMHVAAGHGVPRAPRRGTADLYRARGARRHRATELSPPQSSSLASRTLPFALITASDNFRDPKGIEESR